MKKLILIVSMLIISMASFANPASELKANLKAIRNDIAAYIGGSDDYRHVKSAHIKYDHELDIADVTFDCPKIWIGTTYYVANNIHTVMNGYANVIQVSDWRYDDEMIFAEYQCIVDDTLSYVIVFDYYRKSNVMMITMYEREDF